MRRRHLIVALGAVALSTPATASSPPAERRAGGGDSYIQIQTLQATMLRSASQRGVISVQLGIDVPDAALRTRANASIPRLRAAYVQALGVYAASLSPGAVPNADYLSQELQRQTDRVLGRAGARLLLGSIILN